MSETYMRTYMSGGRTVPHLPVYLEPPDLQKSATSPRVSLWQHRARAYTRRAPASPHSALGRAASLAPGPVSAETPPPQALAALHARPHGEAPAGPVQCLGWASGRPLRSDMGGRGQGVQIGPLGRAVPKGGGLGGWELGAGRCPNAPPPKKRNGLLHQKVHKAGCEPPLQRLQPRCSTNSDTPSG